jgi:hypothetical protein
MPMLRDQEKEHVLNCDDENKTLPSLQRGLILPALEEKRRSAERAADRWR